ncbi:uncharacterized protein DUF721 [Kineococcus xinjiangensis]|uniref:Uncharacterized protein DUF721 n=1 Tax=Kineococcus xinjiangensis TaxID=512762 RepID=A0A2S6II47_9ACTN|nr:DciA family protein [Kineococcus xinjiangensis]PPK93856.1 uncharacterized protein DUF721 [Kineococcus xinjiangensis]
MPGENEPGQDEPEPLLPPPGVDLRTEPEDPAAGTADAVRAALGRARAAATARGLTPTARTRGGGFEAPRTAADRAADRAAERDRRRSAAARSGAWPDARDPQPLKSLVDRLVGERGWREPVSVGGVFGRWDAVVGSEVAQHCRPETFDEGKLTVRAESTAWATQVRLLVPDVLRRLDEELGSGVVTAVVVRGPQGPSWRKGGRSAPGARGPRDTYG